MGNLGNSSSLFASVIWGGIGLGFAIYGKRQGDMVPLFGGVALMAITYFIGSAFYMSLAGAGLLAAILWLKKRGL